MADYYTTLTTTGLAKVVAALSGGPALQPHIMAVGDGGGPNFYDQYDRDVLKQRSSLVNQHWADDLNLVDVDPNNPAWVITEGLIPTQVGGWYIREVGIFDADGDMIAIGVYPETYKPVATAVEADLLVRSILEVGEASVVQLKIDPSQVMATRAWVLESAIPQALTMLDDAVERAEVARDIAQLAVGIYATEQAGIDATEADDYFWVALQNEEHLVALYKNEAGTADFYGTYPSGKAFELLLKKLNNAILKTNAPSNSNSEFYNDDDEHALYSITDKNGNNLAEWDDEGHQIIVTRQEFYNDDDDITLYSICDKNRIPILSVDYNLQPIIPFMGEFFNDDVETSEYAWVDKNGYIYRAMDASGKTIVGGGSDVDFAELNKTDQIIDDGAAWINRESVSVKRDYSSAYKQSATTQFPTTQSVYDALDALMSEFPDYVSSFSIGQDGLGEEIMCYRFRSADYVVLEQGNSYPQESVERPKIIVSGGLHGIEQHVIPGNQAFFEELCRQWREIDRLDDLRWGVEFLYLPVTNPSGFSARTRRNHNNIDLNRNFPTRWPGTTASGPSPASEAETQSLMQFMSEHTDAIAFIDHHRMFQFQTGGERLVWVGTEGANNVGVGLNAVNKTIADIKRLMPFVPQGNEPVGAISSHFNGSMVLHAEEEFGIPGFLVESPSQLGGNITQLHVHARNCLFNLVYELFDKERINRSNNFVINETPEDEGNGDD